MGLSKDFARSKFRGAYSVTIATQKEIATAHRGDGNVLPVMRDTGQSVLRFSGKAGLARFLRNSPPPVDTVYRVTGLDLSGVDLRGAALQQVEFKECNLAGADFSDATMVRASIKHCNLRRAKFTNANTMSTVIEHCDMTGARFDVRNCVYVEMSWCTNPPAIPRGEKFEPAYIAHAEYTGQHKIRGLMRKLA